MRSRQDHIGISALAVMAALACPAAAHAAEDGIGNAAEIVVTAQKREQRVNEVPMSISALSGKELADKGIVKPGDLEKSVPGFSYTVSGYQTPVYILRGVGYFESSLAADPAVSVYVDEVSLPYSAMTIGAGLDLERVEVLKGPQGILFGRNSTGGAINYVAARPTADFGAGMRASYRRFGEVELEGHVTGPISDTLRVRVAARTDQGGDWQRSYTRRDSLGAKDLLVGRAIVEWTPSAAFTAQLNVNGWRDRSDNQAPQLVALIPKTPANIPDVPGTFLYPLAPANDRAADWNAGRSLRNDNSLWQTSLRLGYDLSSDISLTSITSYADYSRYAPIDQDGSTLNIIDSLDVGGIKSFFQELRLSGKTDALTWVFGGNYERDRISERLTSFLGDSTGGKIAGVRYNGAQANNVQIAKTYALFGNAEYEILPGLSIQGGARYTKADRSFDGCSGDVGDGRFAAAFVALQTALKGGRSPVIPIAPGECTSLDANLDPARLVTDFNQDNISWRAGLSWKGEGGLLLYANVSQGYKAGGFPTTTAATLTQFTPVSQEKVVAYEAGFKVPLWDRKIQWNGAVFRMDYTDKQVRGIIPDPVLRTVQALVNVPKSKIEGAEGQVHVRPVRGLDLDFSGTYLHTRVDDFIGLDVFGLQRNFDGSRLPYTPKWQAVADARYAWPVGDRLSAFVGGHLTYHSGTNAQLGGVPVVAIRAYTLVDLNAGIESVDGRWKAMLFGENVTNKYYWNSANSISDVVVRYAGMPARYGVSFSFQY
ncbi:TonB-dependent receptor [Rhizorhabdus histidinilytica]|uniref:TonB-dependent receptor n=1 Tax=Rhizorhabdus histidinilytica TaxID=439228 RepID=UPI00321F9793